MIKIDGYNEFMRGWLLFVMGQPRPVETAAADGWDMAHETPPCGVVRLVVLSDVERGRVAVVEEAT